MEIPESLSPDYNQTGYSQPTAPAKPAGSKPSGLKLVLPALKGGKPIKSGKSKRTAESTPQDEERKIPRPVKLKPLKEVLTKLITQIKKKDDYAFFLKPVDLLQTPGYSDVVKHPMDFGTMSMKVERGKYRSLEEFTSDLRLVTGNAKLFNPHGTIYHTEADKIESWGLDHIAKAASTVIQYETDWNIEIEKDDEGQINIDEEEDYNNPGIPMEVDDTGSGARSPSVASQVQPGTSRRGVRGSYKKNTNSTTVSESIDAEGRLPGSKDGLGAFPSGSDWARTMVALKLKGKRYRTKKERMRIEKEGPPLLADGSIDYTEMEDPFSILSTFVPEPPFRPYFTSLHPPLFPTSDTQTLYDPSSLSQSQPPQPSAPFPTSINLPFKHSSSKLSTSNSDPPVSNRRRHWVVARNIPRNKGKDRDDDQDILELPTGKTPREPHATDFGSFALLAGVIEEEMRQRRIVGKEGEEEEKFLELIRESLDPEALVGDLEPENSPGKTEYWSTQRAATAEEYIRDTVYGGVDGLAYIRSLAEFVAVGQRQNPGSGSDLGMPLATWVEKNLVDPLTGGRHALLREAAFELNTHASLASFRRPQNATQENNVSAQVSNSLYVYPSATVALSALRQIATHKIDMGSLIKTPGELFLSEEEWAGKIFRERKKPHGAHASNTTVEFEVEEPERTWMDIDTSAKNSNGNGADSDYELEGPEELNEVLDYVAGVIISLDKKIRDQGPSSTLTAEGAKKDIQGGLVSSNKPSLETQDGESKTNPNDSASSSELLVEDPILRNLRLNLLALAKRAPLDTIARLPKDLVPEHIRHFVPTLGASN